MLSHYTVVPLHKSYNYTVLNHYVYVVVPLPSAFRLEPHGLHQAVDVGSLCGCQRGRKLQLCNEQKPVLFHASYSYSEA